MEKGQLDIYSGKFKLSKTKKSSFFIPSDDYLADYPNICPNCKTSTKIDEDHTFTIISKHNTGVQKVNQVMADALMRAIRNDGKDKNNAKLVLFSDSRQAAAKLSAGIELDHYRDILRQIVLNSLDGENEIIDFLKSSETKDLNGFLQKIKSFILT